MMERREFLMLAVSLAGRGAVWAEGKAKPELPVYRLGEEGWGVAAAADVRAVLDSVLGVMWRYFPGRKLRPMVVLRGRSGPIVHFRPNALGETVVQLDTQDLFWCQYVYQFAHEFCHVLCGYDDDWKGNLWFEEALCEAASLFVLRQLAAVWAADPPYPSWGGFAVNFRLYADDVLGKYPPAPLHGAAAWLHRHGAELQKSAVNRELNGAVAGLLLELLEAAPQQWEAVTWLNSAPSQKGETFAAYLQKWHDAAPERCRGFIKEVQRIFGLRQG